jgi:DNA polymerase-3 subunit delta'
VLNLPWLRDPLERALAVHAAGRLAHALLVRGGEGWGETVLAERLALELIGRPDVAAARTLAHPDLKWVQPDGAVIKVDDIRELAAFAVGTRQSGPCKVAVIEAAELMNASAANALLKTLEEPPPDTYLLLTSSRPGRLLPTIVSRCQALVIPPDAAAAERWLAERWPEEAVTEKLFECGAAPLSVDAALASEEPPLGPLLGELAASPRPVSERIGALLSWDVDRLTAGWYRHCVALLAGQGRIAGLPSPVPADLSAFADELLAVRRQLLTTNSANQRLLYERLAARWQGLAGAH